MFQVMPSRSRMMTTWASALCSKCHQTDLLAFVNAAGRAWPTLAHAGTPKSLLEKLHMSNVTEKLPRGTLR